VSVPMTLSDLERRNARGHFFQADLLNARIPFDLERPISAGGEGPMGQPPPPQGGEAQCSPILGFFYLCVHPLMQKYPMTS